MLVDLHSFVSCTLSPLTPQEARAPCQAINAKLMAWQAATDGTTSS